MKGKVHVSISVIEYFSKDRNKRIKLNLKFNNIFRLNLKFRTMHFRLNVWVFLSTWRASQDIVINWGHGGFLLSQGHYHLCSKIYCQGRNIFPQKPISVILVLLLWNWKIFSWCFDLCKSVFIPWVSWPSGVIGPLSTFMLRPSIGCR